MSRLALLSTAVSLSLLATPVLAQTFSGPNGNDTVATREQGNTATVGQVGNPNYNGWNNGGLPMIGPVFGAVTAPFAMATGGLDPVWPGLRPLSRLQRPIHGGLRTVRSVST